MNLSEFQSGIELTINTMRASHKKRAIAMGNDTMALVKRRVIQSGTKSDGASFKPYSDRKVPTYRFYGKSRSISNPNRGAERLLSEGKYYASYKDFREAEGLQTGHKDFSFTSSMWKSIYPSVSSFTADVATVTIQPHDPRSSAKASNISRLENENFLKPSKQEMALVLELYFKAIQDQFFRSF